MLFFLKLLFWGSLIGLFHTYLLYPIILKIKARNKENNKICYNRGDDLPIVSMIMSVYNEEKVIKEKMESLIALDYPKDKLKIYIGSDHSDDQTNQILNNYQIKVSNLSFYPFKERRGKPDVVNDLATLAFKERGQNEEHIFLMTDASVILKPSTLFELVKHFKNEEIMIVDSNMVNIGMKNEGISKLENQYISSEVGLKKFRRNCFWKDDWTFWRMLCYSFEPFFQ